MAGDVDVVEEYLPPYLEDQTNVIAEELRRFEEAVNHLVREQREVLQDGA